MKNEKHTRTITTTNVHFEDALAELVGELDRVLVVVVGARRGAHLGGGGQRARDGGQVRLKVRAHGQRQVAKRAQHDRLDALVHRRVLRVRAQLITSVNHSSNTHHAYMQTNKGTHAR